MPLLYPFYAFWDFVTAVMYSDLCLLVVFSFVLFVCVACPLYTLLHIKD